MSYKQVYIVDNDALVADTISFILSYQGYRVKAFASAEACISAVSREMPDMVISDVFLDTMSGLEMAAHFYRNYPELDCLLISARSTLLCGRHQESGPGEYLEIFQKPMHPTVLLKEVARRLGKACVGANNGEL